MNTIDVFIYLDLEPIQYYGPENFNSSSITVNANSSSDFEKISLICTDDVGQGFPCSNHTVENINCTTSFNINLTLGCNFTCSFTVKKFNYTDVPSDRVTLTTSEHLCKTDKFNHSVHLDPPTPNIISNEIGSRWISIIWTIPERAHIKSFDVFQNGTKIANLTPKNFSTNATRFSYNYTDLEPFRQ